MDDSVPDFRTKDGCVKFVQSAVLGQVETVFRAHQRIHKFGFALATMVNGTQTAEPRALPVALGAYGGREARRVMSDIANKSRAIGTVLVRQDEFKLRSGSKVIDAIVVQLEHKSFGDLTWTSHVVKVASAFTLALEPWIGPTELGATQLDVKPLRFLAMRWMS